MHSISQASCEHTHPFISSFYHVGLRAYPLFFRVPSLIPPPPPPSISHKCLFSPPPSGIVTCRRGDLAGSALCRPPIYGENILVPENVGRYFCSPQSLGLDNAERCYITGVVARNVDSLLTDDSSKEVSEKMTGKSLTEVGNTYAMLYEYRRALIWTILLSNNQSTKTPYIHSHT